MARRKLSDDTVVSSPTLHPGPDLAAIKVKTGKAGAASTGAFRPKAATEGAFEAHPANYQLSPWARHHHLPGPEQYIGSGTMVNKHHVITAGHVVFSKANGGWATSVQF